MCSRTTGSNGPSPFRSVRPDAKGKHGRELQEIHQRMRDLSNVVRLASGVSAVLVIVASLSPKINDGNDASGYPIMFSWHPVFMTIGLFLLTQGLVSYISTFGAKVWKISFTAMLLLATAQSFPVESGAGG
jgi:hypothetical protein